MQVTVNIECTPQEARTFFGLPDMTPINEKLTEEAIKRIDANVELLEPEAFVRNWLNLGNQLSGQFMNIMSKAAGGSTASARPTETKD
ncbi:MAG: DUF6489 family protein [Maricaulaceae bacterium]